MRRHHLAGATALALLMTIGCSQQQEKTASQDLKTFDVQESAAPSAPGIVPTAAPGVAFTYRYGFRLPDTAISAAQEAHAASCEKLGLARCRITGMTYQLDDRDRVEGSLEIAIDPLLARGFGRDAIAAIEKQDGKLRFAEITGEDQNPALDDAARREGGAKGEIEKLEAELARARTENERVTLREQLRVLRQQITDAQGQKANAETRILRTPMTFAYAGGATTGRGFAGENPARDAWYMFIDSAATMIGFFLKALAVVLPWAVLLGLLIALARSRLAAPIRRWWKGKDSTPEGAE
jgi:hypothetical protein